MLHSHPILAGVLGQTLEAACTRYLALDPHSTELLRPLAGKLIALHVRPFGGAMYLCPTDTGLQVQYEISGPPDASLSGSLPAFARLGLGGEARASLASGEIEIEGDMETARRFQALFAKLDIDWEALLARYTGSGIAGVAANLVRSGLAWTRDSADSLRTDLAEYWQEESRELPARSEIEGFHAGVDRLRHDVARLEARVQRLESAREHGQGS